MHGPHSQTSPCWLSPYLAPSPPPSILSSARPQPLLLLSPSVAFPPPPASKSALVPFPHSSLRGIVKQKPDLAPLLFTTPCVFPHHPQCHSRLSSLGNEDNLTWPLPVIWPHDSATLHIVVALVTLTYLGFPKRAQLDQDSRLYSCESFSGVAIPPIPPLLSCSPCLSDILPLPCPIVW